MNTDAEERYADIIHLSHPVSRRHPQMSMADRAAQFSPFAALNGHEEAIAEAARTTEQRPVLDDMEKERLSALLQSAAHPPHPALRITCFVPDSRKAGGACVEIHGRIQKLLPVERMIVMEDGTRVPMDEVMGITILS